MKVLATASASLIAISCFTMVPTVASAKNKKPKLARVKHNADGTITELEEKDKMTIERRTLREKANGERVISSKSTYILDRQERPRSCVIADGKGNVIFKVRYGYSKTTGLLSAESMFDMRVKRLNNEGQEIPVQRLYYKYDAHGNRSKPFAITTQRGKPVEKIAKWNKHIQKRLEKIRFNTTDSTTLEQKDIDTLRR